MGKFIVSFRRQGTITPSGSDLVALGILTKPIAEFSNSDKGTTVLIPYNDESGKILLNNGCIEFEVAGVNHHKDTNNADTPTITLMTKNIIRKAAFDAKEPNNPLEDLTWQGERMRASYGNNRWSVSNIRQWLNSSGEAGKWFTKQHDYDEPPTSDYVEDSSGAYANDPGFLAGFSANVLQHFTEITNTTVLCTADGGGSETTVDKVFLPSYTEMGFGDYNGIAEGALLFTLEESLGKSNNFNDSYLLRSNNITESHTIFSIHYTVGEQEDSPYGSIGITPIIVLH